MPKKVPAECEGIVKALAKENMTVRAIVGKVKSLGFTISRQFVMSVTHCSGQNRKAAAQGKEPPPNKLRRTSSKKALVTKVRSLATKENPLTQTDMAKKLSVSVSTIRRIVHDDLQLQTRKKPKVHKLTEAHVKQRKTVARRLKEKHLAGSWGNVRQRYPSID